jgi:hypothetical protein
MVIEDLIKRSPLRILENSIHGGLGKGNIGVLASRKGVGKTACLVHLATDKLFQDKRVIHVSYSTRVDHIITWYDDIYRELARSMDLESAAEVHDDLVRKRVIMSFSQEGTRTEQVLRSLEAMIQHGRFAAETIIVDGFNFPQSSPDDLRRFKEFAGRMGLELWFSASLKSPDPLFDEQGTPVELKGCLDYIDVLITLQPWKGRVELRLVKDHAFASPPELRLSLNPTTLLIDEP